MEAIRSGKIRCRVYKKDKFHAKAYITHARQEVVGSFALVGSSNLTLPGITENIELNVQIAGTPVSVLQEWYEEHWNNAEDITAEILQVIERHTRDYSPFEVYIRALHEFCRGHSLTANEWEAAGPEQRRLPHVLRPGPLPERGLPCPDGYRQAVRRRVPVRWRGLGQDVHRLDGHRAAGDPRRQARGAVRPQDGPGGCLGTRASKPDSAHVGGTGAGVFSGLVVFNHTDLGLSKFQDDFERVKELADVIVIDEAHHFRNPGNTGEDGGRPSRYRELLKLMEGPRGKKELFLLTATPVNNSLHDFRHMAELFMGRKEDGTPNDNYFAQKLGIHSLRRHFVDMERELLRGDDPVRAA